MRRLALPRPTGATPQYPWIAFADWFPVASAGPRQLHRTATREPCAEGLISASGLSSSPDSPCSCGVFRPSGQVHLRRNWFGPSRRALERTSRRPRSVARGSTAMRMLVSRPAAWLLAGLLSCAFFQPLPTLPGRHSGHCRARTLRPPPRQSPAPRRTRVQHHHPHGPTRISFSAAPLTSSGNEAGPRRSRFTTRG